MVDCPECGLPCEELSRWTCASTSGFVEMVKLRCLGGSHWFTLPTYIDVGAA